MGADVLTVMELAREAPARAVATLKRLYGLTDRQLAELLGIQEQDFRARRRGSVKFTPAELKGLAFAFEIPVDVLFEEPEHVARAVIENDPGLSAYWRHAPFPPGEWVARDSNPEPTGSGRVLRLDLEVDHAGRADRAA